MFKNLLVVLLAIALGCKSGSPLKSIKDKSKSAILFSVNNSPVSQEEFEYVYKKNNINNDSAFSRSDIKAYLDLYINFKLKIEEAKSRGMDTTKAFKDEFNGYLEQLKKPYLTESKVTEHLIQEAYDRYKEEIKASHILVKIKDPLNPEDTLNAYKKIMEIRAKALSGTDFGTLAKQYSDDPSAQKNNGNLGYFSSFQMVYPFESAAYNTNVDEVSMPVKTQFGYHIVKVFDRRPANGKVQVAHIMVRIKGDSAAVKNKIFEIYDQANGGVSWDELVKLYSEDINSKNTNGTLNPFTIGQMPYQFQEASFALQNPGDISDPIMTDFGWHIIKLIKKEPIESFSQMEPTIKSRISRDMRAQLNKKALIKRLKKENGFSENLANKNLVLQQADSSLIQGKWKSAGTNVEPLFTIADQVFNTDDFYKYVVSNEKPSSYVPKTYMGLLYDAFQEEKIIAYEEAHLSDKYLDYRMIVKEYQEGILLFDLMEKEVWNKAVEDTVGLKAFYETNKSTYKWGPRANATIYSSAKNNVIDEIKTAINSNDTTFLSKQSLYKKYNSGASLTLQTDSGNFEKGVNQVLDQCEWKPGVQIINMAGMQHLVWIKEILAPQIKELNETKGAVISDYQSDLEKAWLKELKEKYTVNINDKVLNSVYESLERN
ncbi:MAG TPA: peptidylprolyl isomerase [Fulvivirga sp.]|nr:peptidylprolyl isomerase [Fulvivirga sp.]